MQVIPELITIDDVRFAITGKDECDVSVIVVFWAEGYTPVSRANINIPIAKDGSIPKGDALREYIMQFAPVEYLNKEIHRYKKGTLVDFSEIDQLIKAGAGTYPVA